MISWGIGITLMPTLRQASGHNSISKSSRRYENIEIKCHCVLSQ